MRIPLGITAKNEAANLGRTLDSVRKAACFAQSRLEVSIDIVIVLNDNTDETRDLLTREQVAEKVMITTGGLVEAQRTFVKANPGSLFVIFSDADIVISENALFEICKTLLQEPLVEIAYVEKTPLRPLRKTALAEALFLYNLHNGYQGHRHYFNGQLFGIRNWSIPHANEMIWNSNSNNRFLCLQEGIRCDDIYLSRAAMGRKGPDCIRLVKARLHYRPPETLLGMFRKYQRMTLEIERLNCFFPESQSVHQRWGKRYFIFAQLRQRPVSEQIFYSLFVAALYICKLLYQLQRFYYSHLSAKPCETWKPVLESKREIA